MNTPALTRQQKKTHPTLRRQLGVMLADGPA